MAANAPRTSDSMLRMAFWRLSLKVRPIAMTSPTLRIWVPSASLLPGNFSNAKRGSS